MSENENPVVATTPDATLATAAVPAVEAVPSVAVVPAIEAAPVAAPVAATPAAPVASPVVAKKTTGKVKKPSGGGRKKVALDAKRGSGFFMLDPEDIILVDKLGHKLCEKGRNMKPLTPAFVESVREYGVITPIIVRKNGDKAEIVNGRMRVRAAREVNKQLRKEGKDQLLVPAKMMYGSDDDAVATSGITQMAFEETMLDKGERLAKLLPGRTLEQVAKMMCQTTKASEQQLELVALSEKLKTDIREGKLTGTAALKFKHLSHEEQDAAVDKMAAASPSDDETQTDDVPPVAKDGVAGEQPQAAQTVKAAKAKPIKRVTEREAKAAAGGIVKPGLKAMRKVRNGLLGQSNPTLAWALGEITSAEFAEKVPSARAGLIEAGLLPGHDDKKVASAKAKKAKGAKVGKKAKKGPAKKTTTMTLDETVAAVTGKLLAGLSKK